MSTDDDGLDDFPRRDSAGNFHDDKGLFISIRDYTDRIFAEKDKLAESQRETLERALVEARETTEKAMVEAKTTVEARLVEAKSAADAVQETNIKRLENLESGGAPFASRLDQSIKTMLLDVQTLKENMVKTTVLDALREQTVTETKEQKRQIKMLFYSVAVSMFLIVINFVIAVATRGQY